MTQLVVKSQRVIFPEGERPAVIVIRDGIIQKVKDFDDEPETFNSQLLDVGEQVVMPGIIDVHVHINEPGRTDWEGFATATRAAAMGGATTLVDMPLNSTPVTTTVENFQAKLDAAEGQLATNVAYHAGVIPNHVKELDQLLSMGAIAGKAFMIDSGMEDFPFSDQATLRDAMRVLKKHGKPLLAHGELDLQLPMPATPWVKYEDYLASRPPSMEIEAVKMLIELCAETDCAVHLVHLSAAEPLAILQEARAGGLPITVETSPHYLYLAAEDISDGATQFKCAPPIRLKENQERLRQALLAEDIDLVATDHSPCPPELKGMDTGDFSTAWGGISSLQYCLPITWSAMRQVGATPVDIARWLCQNPARSMGLQQLGRIGVGKTADLTIWDPERELTVSPAVTQHRHKITPYDGATLTGKVTHTILGGNLIFEDGVVNPGLRGRSILKTG